MTTDWLRIFCLSCGFCVQRQHVTRVERGVSVGGVGSRRHVRTPIHNTQRRGHLCCSNDRIATITIQHGDLLSSAFGARCCCCDCVWLASQTAAASSISVALILSLRVALFSLCSPELCLPVCCSVCALCRCGCCQSAADTGCCCCVCVAVCRAVAIAPTPAQ